MPSERSNTRYKSDSQIPFARHKEISQSSSSFSKGRSLTSSVYNDRGNSKNRAPQNILGGTILNIYLKNFMNHCKLDWSPIGQVNIITGANGAGKSSILQAIVIGLGGSAKYTKRHSSVAKFV